MLCVYNIPFLFILLKYRNTYKIWQPFQFADYSYALAIDIYLLIYRYPLESLLMAFPVFSITFDQRLYYNL